MKSQVLLYLLPFFLVFPACAPLENGDPSQTPAEQAEPQPSEPDQKVFLEAIQNWLVHQDSTDLKTLQGNVALISDSSFQELVQRFIQGTDLLAQGESQSYAAAQIAQYEGHVEIGETLLALQEQYGAFSSSQGTVAVQAWTTDLPAWQEQLTSMKGQAQSLNEQLKNFEVEEARLGTISIPYTNDTQWPLYINLLADYSNDQGDDLGSTTQHTPAVIQPGESTVLQIAVSPEAYAWVQDQKQNVKISLHYEFIEMP